ncbi:penicillin-binding transpeptidase domain-containing protein [Caldalkalibacillus salinus]|uniref:penicillin-binding transpeptidase domain-containing protein n=1 Tax=Caldalkalibacillus salinus TaxID=2803787 RepID=UPI001924FB6A|nr:penicillin-binding transpeptidase domain-containing protein [Caldalkalibacillus salinus]
MKTFGVFMLSLLLIFLLTGCTEEIKPEDVLESYITYWEQGDYEQMYGLISESSQAVTTKDEFVQRYRTIYEGIDMSDLEVAAVYNDDEEEENSESAVQSFPYQMKMGTVAGPIDVEGTVKMTKNKETNEWKVTWTPSLLFPSMTGEDKVIVRTIKADRGEIYDRNGQKLAKNGSIEELGLVPGQMGEEKERTITELAERLSVTKSFIHDKLAAPWVEDDLFVPIVNVTKDREDLDFSDLQGVTKRQKNARVYPYGESVAHLVGYIREVSAEDIEENPDKKLKAGDTIGKAGLEQIYEERLRGQNGVQISIVKANGQHKETLAKNDPVHGEDVHLTIDARLQHLIYQSLDGDAGSGAAIHPRTGEILALVSSPAYDPNAFIQGLSTEQWTTWNEDPKKPLMNRFTSLYAPGSVFKPITAAIGIELGVSAADELRTIDGLRWSKDESWGNYYVKRVKDVPVETLTDAIMYSDNIYLAQEAMEIGAEAFTREAETFGFGLELPIAYPFPQASLSNEGITSDILLADSAYGQGQVQMTPLHLALAYTPFINRGELIKPVLELAQDVEPVSEAWGKIIDSETADTVNNMLLEVVENPEGTGHGATIEGHRIAGKTGTAELKRSKEEEGQENGWFVMYDAEQEDLLVTVMIEDVQHRGGSAYVLRKTAAVVREYFNAQ